MDDNRLDECISEEPCLNEDPSCRSENLPFDPHDWDTALSSFLDLPDGWADEVKNEYDDPVADLICAGLPEAYIGTDPAEIEMDYTSLTEAVNDMDSERRAAVQRVAGVVLREFFDPRGTLKHVHSKATSLLPSTPSFGNFKSKADDNTESDVSEETMQNALASLNDPDSPFSRVDDIEATVQSAQTPTSYVFEDPPREGDYIDINIGTVSEARVKVTEVGQFRQNGVLRTILSVTVVNSVGNTAPEEGTEATVLPQSLVQNSRHYSGSSSVSSD